MIDVVTRSASAPSLVSRRRRPRRALALIAALAWLGFGAHAALAVSTYPKLLFAAEPGALVPPAIAEEFAHKLKDCRLVKLGDGIHYLQEDHPETIGRSLAAFIAEVESRKGREAA